MDGKELAIPATVEHFHHMDKVEPKVKIKIEKNSKSINWEVSYEHEDAAVALSKIRAIHQALRAEYGD